MKIIITGRHFEVSEDLSKYAEKKFSKLEKYFHRLIDIELIMYMEKHNHVIEAVINGDGMRFYAMEKANDMYSSIDLLIKSLEKQAVKHKERHSEHKVQPIKNIVNTDSAADDGLEIAVNQIANKPKDELEAFLEMKVDNKDFILFKKNTENNKKNPEDFFAVIYKSENGFRMAELSQKLKKEKRFDAENLLEFDLIIKNDSMPKPKIKFKKCRKKAIKSMAMNSAVKELLSSEDEFIPFFNNETTSFNIICKNGENIEMIVPPV